VSPPTLKSSLADLSGVGSDGLRDIADAVREEMAEATDPLADLLPPEGIVALPVAQAARAIAGTKRGNAHVAGVLGSASAALVAEVARTRRVVLVSADLDDARRLADDVAFFLRPDAPPSRKGAAGKPGPEKAAEPTETEEPEEAEDEEARGQVLLFSGAESSPYADVNADRRAAMSRMATLHHLSSGHPWKVLVIPASALVRKVVPRAVVRAASHKIIAEDELDRDRLLARLAESGYLRVPVVEDPGSFAVRGALLDVWPPAAPRPYRVELYGELVISIKAFDPFEQRTLGKSDKGLPELSLPPAREAILTKETAALARDRVQQLADMVDLPTTRARALAEDVTTGRAFFGAEGFLPAYYDSLESLLFYVGDDALVVLDDPAAVTREVRAELTRAEDDVIAKAKEAHFLPATFYLSEDEAAAVLTRLGVVSLHRTLVLGGSAAAEAEEGALARFETASAAGTVSTSTGSGAAAIDVASGDQQDLTRAVTKTLRPWSRQ
jgi:transcription-repair coupling factor (superfamily II helicase)